MYYCRNHSPEVNWIRPRRNSVFRNCLRRDVSWTSFPGSRPNTKYILLIELRSITDLLRPGPSSTYDRKQYTGDTVTKEYITAHDSV